MPGSIEPGIAYEKVVHLQIDSRASNKYKTGNRPEHNKGAIPMEYYDAIGNYC